MHYSYFSLWQNFFFQFLIIVDFILIGPGILVGLVTLGVLNQVSHAFGKVSDSMAYLVGTDGNHRIIIHHQTVARI